MISIVIPAFNEKSFLPICLDSIRRQSYRDYEVIVVAGGEDGTAKIATRSGARLAWSNRRGIAAARSAGFACARGEIIASTDADTILPPDWLSRMEERFREQPETVAVAGHFLLYDGPAFVRAGVRLSLALMPSVTRAMPGIWNFGGFNFAVRADAFRRAGGFNVDLDFGEDVDLCRRLKRAGKVCFDPELVVRMSGRAFQDDRTGAKNLANYLSVLLRGRPSLPVVHGCDVAQARR